MVSDQGQNPAPTPAPDPPPNPLLTHPATAGVTTPVPDEKRVDAGIFEFWTRSRQAFFDVCVTITNARIYRHKVSVKWLADRERKKG